MNRTLNRLRCCLAVAACLAMVSSHAASVSGQQRQDYGRLNFGFDAPTQLKASVNGTKATLSFDAPIAQSADAVKAALPGYVTDANLSADKKTLTLTLNQPYRVRQFTSGNKVGLDLIGAGAPDAPKPKETTVAKAEPDDAAMLTTKKETPAAKPKPAEKPTPPKPAAKKEPSPKPAAPKPDPILSTKAPEVPATKSTPSEEAAMLSTKGPEVNVPVMTTVAAPEPPAPEKPAPAVAEPPVVATPSAAPAATPTNDRSAFVVTAKTANGETALHFPWKNRTAAAVFKRGRDVWVVFSAYRDINAGLLSTVMPQQVAGVTQYSYEGNTIVRFATDGSIHARATQPKGSQSWDITLTPNVPQPKLDIPISADSLEGTMRMILGVFDVAPTLRFYDPTVGDQLVIVPAYEPGRAVSNARNFPEFGVLATGQGVAVTSKRPDLAVNQTRAGVILGGDGGLAVSENLPVVAGTKPLPVANANMAVMMPYDQWFVPPEKFVDTLMERLHLVATATKAAKADALMGLVKLYLSYGYGPEALGVLSRIREEFPEYYVANRLAILNAAAHVLLDHMDEAALDLQAPELVGSEEAALWQQVVLLTAPAPSTVQLALEQAVAQADGPAAPATAPNDSVANTVAMTAEERAKAVAAVTAKPSFQFLKYTKPYIRFYPPRIRQRLASIASDAYLADGQEEKALAVFDTLVRDGTLGPLKQDAEFALGRVAVKKGEFDQALQIFDRLTKQTENRRVAARAKAAAAELRFSKSLLTASAAAEEIERARFAWRGDAVERDMLERLARIYKDGKRYDDVLRTQKSIIDGFPNDPHTLAVSGEMSELFRSIFLDGLADEMDPLKALSLFYEFKELTPLGDSGDKIIQHLADRLAAIDLLDRAAQLLEHQVKFRATGENRSRIGARLALLNLLDKRPQEALEILEITNFGGNPPPLQQQRRQLTAETLLKLAKYEEALGVLFSDTSKSGQSLRLDILWAMKDWPNVVNHAEDMLSERPNLTEPLTLPETEVLLKLAIAYTFEGDYTQLRFLRDYYSGLIPDSGYKKIFEFITNENAPLDAEDFAMVAQQISRTEGFLSEFKEKIAAGKLSEAIK